MEEHPPTRYWRKRAERAEAVVLALVLLWGATISTFIFLS